MIILGSLIGVFILTRFIKLMVDCSIGWEFICDIISIVSIVIFISGISTIPISRMEYQANIREYAALETTLQEMRKKESIENTAIQLKVAECNQWLARSKYWNNSVWDLWIPNEIENINPIK